MNPTHHQRAKRRWPRACAAMMTLIAVNLAGCASSSGLRPSGELLDPVALAMQRTLGNDPASADAWPSEDWWTGLGDAQLSGLVEEALKGNPDLSAADARARQALALAGAADADRGPAINANASLNGQRQPTSVVPADSGGGTFGLTKAVNLSFSWGLDLWGGKRAAWAAAVGQARAADIDARAARIEVSTNVARAYAQLGYAYAQDDVARAEQSRAAQVLTLTRQRVAKGIDNELQRKRAESDVASADQQQAAAAWSIASARIALAVLLGRGPDRGLDIARPHLLLPTTVAMPANLPADLLGRRADLVAARWQVAAASQNILAAKAQFLPNLSISALAGFAAQGGATLFSAPSRAYQVQPAISLPIFDGGRLRASLAGQNASYDLAVAYYNKTLIGALNQVADHLNAAQSLQLQVKAQQRALDLARESWQLAERRYQSGVGSYLEALSVRQQLLAADQRVAALHAQQVDLSVQLIQALGGGFRPQADDVQLAAESPSNSNKKAVP